MPSTRQRISSFLELLPKVQHRDRRVLLVCITVALVFWLILNLSRDYSINKEVAITYQAPEGKLLLNTPTQMADLTIKGQGWNLLRESFRIPVIDITVGLDNEADGYISKGDVARMVEQKLASSQLTIEQLNFDPVQLETVDQASKRVPIEVFTKFSYQDGYRPVADPVALPDSVTLYGVKEEIDSVTSWPADTLKAESVNSSFQGQITLVKPENGTMTLSDYEVVIEQEVEAFTEKSLYVPVTVLNAPTKDSFRIFPEQVRLKVAILQSDYNSIVADSFRLVADLKGMRTEDQRNSIPLVLEKQPQKVVSVQYTPRSAEYFLIKN